METLLPIIIQLVAGAAGGGGIASVLKNVNLGGMGNMIAGAVGGVGGGQLASILGLIGGAGGAAVTGEPASGLDFGNLIGSAISGGAGGAILTGIVGSIMGGKKD